MAATTYHTIIIKNVENAVQNEGTAGGTITPGMLVMLNSSSQVVVHNVAGGSVPEKAFALEDDLQGRGITDNYDSTTYKNVRYQVCPPGTEVYALIAANAHIAVGDKLESNGNGYLREHIVQSPGAGATSPAVGIRTGQVVAVALEAKDSTSPVGAGRLRVRVV